MVVGPMTMLLLACLGAVFVGGVLIILRGVGGGSPGGAEQICTRCRNANQGQARFCAHCGKQLS
ncbi:MAG: hypothetical protein IIB61_00710 [Planctomycetes bacterium]|nr:hypothetical protein [Planctomycetota bacterium]